MVPIEELRVRAIGERRRQVAHLHQPVEPQLADPLEVGALQARPAQHVGQKDDRAIGEARQARERQDRRVRPDLGVEVSADAAERVVQLERRRDRRSPRRACRRHGGKAGTIGADRPTAPTGSSARKLTSGTA